VIYITTLSNAVRTENSGIPQWSADSTKFPSSCRRDPSEISVVPISSIGRFNLAEG